MKFINIIESIKSSVTPKQIAEFNGLKVSHNGMALCPFHYDKHPSLKLYSDHLYCFGCGYKGDVINFTSDLLNLTTSESIEKICTDFGIRETKPSVLTKLKNNTQKIENEKLCFRVLREYSQILKDWKIKYAPTTSEEAIDSRFTEACQMFECTEYLLEQLIIGSPEEREEMVRDMMKDEKIKLLEEYIVEIRGNKNE